MGEDSNAKVYLTTADVARRLDLVPATVRLLARAGRLPHTVTASGVRLFRPEDVDLFAAERARRGGSRA
jgi:DNA-binding transcriptional MerR regulator